MKEHEHQKKAFEFYYGLGEQRSYRLVAEEFKVALGTVKMWGRTFGWRERVQERDAEVARAVADRSLKEATGKVVRNRKLVEMGLMQVAKAIAESKVKVSVSDLDRLIRLEGFLREGEGDGSAGREGEGSLLEEVKKRFADRCAQESNT